MKLNDLDFLVQYEVDILHAIDGINSGVVIIPVNGNFLIKVYDKERPLRGTQVNENFSNVVKPLVELAAVFLKN